MQGTYGRQLVARLYLGGGKGGAISMMKRIIYAEYSDYLYVFWVKTGQEEKAADEIRATFDADATPLLLLVETFFRKQGKVKKEIRTAFPGYVFVVSGADNDEFIWRARECARKSKIIMRVLCYGDTNEAVMRNEERASIDSLWHGKECIETSAGFIKGDRIYITEGHLKGRESIIKEIHPRSRQAIVEIEFMGGVRRAAVGLEILEKLP